MWKLTVWGIILSIYCDYIVTENTKAGDEPRIYDYQDENHKVTNFNFSVGTRPHPIPHEQFKDGSTVPVTAQCVRLTIIHHSTFLKRNRSFIWTEETALSFKSRKSVTGSDSVAFPVISFTY